MRTCIAIRHLPFEDLASFESVLGDEGFDVSYIDAPEASRETIESASPDLLVVLGGPVSATDENDYPFIESELKLLEQRLADDRPTLGICLGGQLMARALGAKVAPAEQGEIGWKALTLSDAGMKSPLRHFDNEPVFHWHGDAFELPSDAVSLASTPDCSHQAFARGTNALGLQFHPEVTPTSLETWYVGHYRALRDPANPDVATLRSDAVRHGATLKENARKVLLEWLAGIEHR
ncbi:MAG TPA: glutamine amidotransferase [Gammaproteobacteria bacterium]